MRLAWMTATLLVGALAMPAGAGAGGWATVVLGSTPDGVSSGQPWVVDLEVLQHGRTPLEGVQPAVTITQRRTGVARTFRARPTQRPGVYRARVVFPAAGRWRYAVNDGFGQTHTYAPVRIAAGRSAPAGVPSGDEGGSFPWAPLVAALVAGLAAAGVARVAQRRRVAGAEG